MSSGWGSSDTPTRRITDLERQLRILTGIVDGLTGGAATTATSVSFTPAGSISSTNVQAALQELDGDIGGKAAASHTHAAADITSGALDIARLPVATSGTSNTTQVVRADDSRLSNARTPTSHTHTASEVTDFSEAVDDRVGALLVAGSNVSLTYNDAGNSLTIAASASGSPYTSGTFSMSTSASSTVVSNGAITTTSRILFIPTNANAFSLDGAVTSYTVTTGSMTVSHANNGLTRTFAYLIIP